MHKTAYERRISDGSSDWCSSDLEAQRDELVEANRQLDGRRRFTEAVLAGVASGVIGLDADGNLNLPNRTGSELLDIDLHAHVGESLRSIVPQMADALAESGSEARRVGKGCVSTCRSGWSPYPSKTNIICDSRRSTKPTHDELAQHPIL